VADFLNNIACGDTYTPAAAVGPYYGAKQAVITVANNAAYFQVAVGSYGSWRWMDEREYFSIAQSFKIGRIIGLRFRNATPGQVARVLVTLSGDDDPEFDSGTPFTGTLSATGQVSSTVSLQTGDIFYNAGAATRTGAVIADGSHYNSVASPIYAALYALIGTTYGGSGSNDFAVPDLLDRVPVGAGRNTTLAANDGVAAANRHNTRHKHNPHTHLPSNNGHFAAGFNATVYAPGSGPGFQSDAGTAMSSEDGGSGIATDPLDGPAYIGLTPYIVL
jgi:microcystin-dependent protein